MSILWMDGFDHYRTSGGAITTEQVAGAYDFGFAKTTSFDTSGVVGGCYYNRMGNFSNRGFTRILAATKTTIGVGCHFKGTAVNRDFASIFQLASTAIVPAFQIGLNNSYQIQLKDGDANQPVVVATSTQALTPGVWTHIEAKVVFNAGSSTVEVRVNGQTWLTYTGTITAANAGSVSLGRTSDGSAVNTDFYYDNFYIWDTAGSTNNDWLGERNVYTIMPGGDTATADWTKSTGSTGYTILDNIPVTADYVEAAAAAVRSVFTVNDLPSTDMVPLAVQVSAYGLKTGTADTEVKVGVVSGGVEAQSAGRPLIQDINTYVSGIFEVNPDTLDPWTPAEINGMSVSLERNL